MSDSLAAGLRTAAGPRPVARLRALVLAPATLLVVLMVLFTAWFAAYSIAQHEAHLTHKADLGQIDQAIWNTAHGRPLQEVVGERVSTRLTDHAEPIFLPLSLLYWLWDDVAGLLAFQALALALGALPVYLLARGRLRGLGYDRGADWAGLALAGCYLLAPALQAAAVSEFHAFALAPPLIAWAFWAVERGHWRRFVLAALLVMAVQEGLALLGAGLGLFTLVRSLPAVFARRASPERSGPDKPQPAAGAGGLPAGAFVLLAGLAWFYLATFVIIPHFAGQAYGIQQTPYAARYGQLGDSFGDVLKGLVLRPTLVLRILAEPLRLRYLAGLLASTGFLALLAPEILALSLPLLLANVLSAFPFQYAGELHYSAPLVPYFAVAAAVGLARLLALVRRGRRGTAGRKATWAGTALPASLVVICGSAMAWQVIAGYTPLGREYWLRLPEGWPVATAHDRLLARFLAQVPAGAAGSTTADLFPHLAHRHLLYQFPALGEAAWALVDVAGTTDRHPSDVKKGVEHLLRAGWGVVDAADGYVLLSATSGAAAIPPSFYDFARQSGVRPQYPLDVTFGGKLRLAGYDVIADPKWRRTGLRYYWQALAPLAPDTALSLQVLAPDGTVVDDAAQRPLAALVWYPPAAWRVGETVVTVSDPWYLPAAWATVIGVKAGAAVLAGAGCAAGPDPASLPGAQEAGSVCLPDGRVRLAVQGVKGADPASAGVSARFQAVDWRVALRPVALPSRAAPGTDLVLRLPWSGWDGRAPGSAGRDYTVFVQLRDAAGRTVAGADAAATWFVPWPTTRWPAAGPGPWTLPDVHTLHLPANLPPGRYTLVAGWYDWQTGARLQLVGAGGNVTGDEDVLGSIEVDPAAALRPDLACLVTAAACASQ